jgi:hypothetical protein
VGRRLAIVISLGLVAGALWMSRRFDWQTLQLRAVNRAMTAKWIPIHLKDGRTLRLDLQDDEMLENVEPEPFPDGHAGSVGRWTRQIQMMPKDDGPQWPAWLAPYPGAERAPDRLDPWFNVSSTERRGSVDRDYRTPDPPERVIEHYRREMQREGIKVTGQTREPSGISGLRGESDDQLRSVTVEIHSGEYSVTYLVTEFGNFKYTPLPDAPLLDLTLASVDEAGQFVRLRNSVDGEILRLPFNCLATEDEFKEMRNVRAAKRPDFLPPYPGETEILPAAEDPAALSIDFRVKREPPSRIAAFYKKQVEGAGFKLESEDSGAEEGLPYAGFRALAADGGRVLFTASQSGEETEAHAMYIKHR